MGLLLGSLTHSHEDTAIVLVKDVVRTQIWLQLNMTNPCKKLPQIAINGEVSI